MFNKLLCFFIFFIGIDCCASEADSIIALYDNGQQAEICTRPDPTDIKTYNNLQQLLAQRSDSQCDLKRRQKMWPGMSADAQPKPPGHPEHRRATYDPRVVEERHKNFMTDESEYRYYEGLLTAAGVKFNQLTHQMYSLSYYQKNIKRLQVLWEKLSLSQQAEARKKTSLFRFVDQVNQISWAELCEQDDQEH